MRRSFDGLAAMAADVIRRDPLSGHLFLFRNRAGDRVKILWWDRDGYAIWYKRLEEGTFELPEADGQATGVEVGSTELALILGGVELASERRERFALPREGISVTSRT